MATHEDKDHGITREWLRSLYEKADRMQRQGLSKITVGPTDEPSIQEWTAICGMHMCQRPEDEHGILRISLGGRPDFTHYCVFRGDPIQCVTLLERAGRALRIQIDKMKEATGSGCGHGHTG